MPVWRLTAVLAGLLFCVMFTGIGLYAVNADGSVEPVVGGYGVIDARY